MNHDSADEFFLSAELESDLVTSEEGPSSCSTSPSYNSTEDEVDNEVQRILQTPWYDLTADQSEVIHRLVQLTEAHPQMSSADLINSIENSLVELATIRRAESTMFSRFHRSSSKKRAATPPQEHSTIRNIYATVVPLLMTMRLRNYSGSSRACSPDSGVPESPTEFLPAISISGPLQCPPAPRPKRKVRFADEQPVSDNDRAAMYQIEERRKVLLNKLTKVSKVSNRVKALARARPAAFQPRPPISLLGIEPVLVHRRKRQHLVNNLSAVEVLAIKKYEETYFMLSELTVINREEWQLMIESAENAVKHRPTLPRPNWSHFGSASATLLPGIERVEARAHARVVVALE
uniref:Uncharacterized protein n=1 Tax=Caenorhabditis japonica TaxID=281687 RepID=A0A8R1DHF0_CAEJA